MVNSRECSPSNPRNKDTNVVGYVDNKGDYHKSSKNSERIDIVKLEMSKIFLMQRADPELSVVISWFDQEDKPEWSEIAQYSRSIKYFWVHFGSFVVSSKVLCRK